MQRAFNAIIAIVLIGGAVASWGETSTLELRAGDCFDDPDGVESMNTEVEAVPTKDCTEPHDNEVYALRTAPDGEWPGLQSLQEFASAACYEAFEPFVERSYRESRLDFGWMVPTEASWEEGDDRTVTCFLYDMEYRELTGSMEDSGV